MENEKDLQAVEITAKKRTVKQKTSKLQDSKTESLKEKKELWGKIGVYSVYLLVFIFPLFFLPFVVSVLDLSKQLLLGILVFLALLFWIFRVLSTHHFEFNLNWLNVPVLALLLIYGLSTIFSLWSYGSFWGWPLDINASFLTLFYFILLYFLISNTILGPKRVAKLFFGLVVSGFIVGILGLLQMYGKYLLPFNFTKAVSFNTLGSPNALAIFLACLMPLAISLFFTTNNKAKKAVLLLVSVFWLAALLLINFFTAWIILIVSMALIFVLGLLNVKSLPNRLLHFAIVLLIVGLFFAVFKINLPFSPQLPLEVSLTQQAELGLIKDSIMKTPVLGSGPGTFSYTFAKFKPDGVNQTILWNTKFSTGASEILDRVITTGILGILSFLALLVMFFWAAFSFFKKKGNETKSKDRIMVLAVFSSLGAIIISYFFYPSSLVLNFTFWVLLAGFVAIEKSKVKSLAIEPSSPQALAASFLLILILIFGVGLSFFNIEKYFADAKYLQGITFYQGGQVDQSISALEKAVKYNAKADIYWRDISQVYLAKTALITQDQKLTDEQKKTQSAEVLSAAIRSINTAVGLNPANVANWNVRAFVYQNLIGAVNGSSPLALESYNKSLELDPKNPYVYTEIGKVYLLKADAGETEGTKEENLKKAEENFQKALSLKNDYAPAQYQIAMMKMNEGKTEEAIAKLEETKLSAPNDTGLAFQLGVIYYNNNQLDKAKAELERLLTIDPNYSNALYILGIIYDKQGNKQAALVKFEKVQSLNPDNQEILKVIDNIKAGRSALDGIVPAQPPISETPSEVKK